MHQSSARDDNDFLTFEGTVALTPAQLNFIDGRDDVEPHLGAIDRHNAPDILSYKASFLITNAPFTHKAIIHHVKPCSLQHHGIGAWWLMETAPNCLRCKVQMVFLRAKSSQEGAARSLFECPSCFRLKSELVVYEHPVSEATDRAAKNK